MRVTPPGRRSTTQRTPEGLEISIPAKRHILATIFLGGWLVGWTFGESFAIRQVLFGDGNDPKLFLGVWLLLWTIGGSVALGTWLWTLAGREVLVLRSDVLIVTRQVFGMGPKREYELRHTKNLRVVPMPWTPYDRMGGLQFWGVGGGPITFDYGSRTVRVANGVDEAEAREIVGELKAQHAFIDTAT